MKGLFGALLFLIMILAPIAIFAAIMIVKKKWRPRRLIPYFVVYAGLFGLFLGYAFGFRGWDLAAAVGLSVLIGFTWSYAGLRSLDTLAERNKGPR